MFRFERLEVWKKAIDFYEAVSKAADKLRSQDQFSLGEQLRRASLSISTNIAEGTGRESQKEANYFFNVSKGSVYEAVSLLTVMKKKEYLTEDHYLKLYNNADEIAKMLSGLKK